MSANVGAIDRIVRIGVGLAVLAAGYLAGSWWGLVGLVPLLTGVIAWCPAYLPFGIRTCPR
jgi:uncharacterized protein (DUF58 family)